MLSPLLFVVAVHAAGRDRRYSLMRRRLCDKLYCRTVAILARLPSSHRSDSPRIAIFAYPTCIRRNHYGVPVGILPWHLPQKN